MILAVGSENGKIPEKRAALREFKIYEIIDSEIKSVRRTKIRDRADPLNFLFERGVDTFLCSAMDEEERKTFSKKGIKVFEGKNGSCDSAVLNFVLKSEKQ